MPLKLPEGLKETLERLDRDLPPLKRYEPGSMFAGAHDAEGLTDDERKGAWAEGAVFNLSSKIRGEASVWGTHFGPLVTLPKEDGTEAHSPDIKAFDVGVLDHWKERSKQAIHPVLRARYADAVWDLQELAIGSRPGVEYAQIAIDAYLDIIGSGKHEGDLEAIFYVERALQIALMVNDRTRIDRAKATMLNLLARSLTSPKLVGLWSFAFDALYDPKSKKLALSVAEQDKLLSHLEEVLRRCCAFGSPDFSAWAAQAAAERLAKHYAGTGQPDEVRRVTRAYGQAFELMAEKADPILAMAWLQPLIDAYHAKGMPDDAKRAELISFEKGKKAKDSLRRISIPSGITQEQFEQFIEALTSGDLDTVIFTVTARFIPRAEEIQELLRRMKEVAPLSSMFPITRLEEGRFVASAGPLDQDPEGRLIMQIAQNLQINSIFLDAALERAKERHQLDAPRLAELLFALPIYEESRRETIMESLRAYCAGDLVKFVSVAVPQVEHALRRLLGLMGQPMFKPTRQGTMDVKNLNDVLREDAIKACLKEDIQLYLLTFLADRRGINLRNDLCHGLVAAERITRPLANQVLHVLLTLALVRQTPPGAAEPEGTEPSPTQQTESV